MARLPKLSVTRQPSQLESQLAQHTRKAASAELAGLAGTLGSGACLTLGTEEEPSSYMYGAVFLLKYTPDGPVIDLIMDVSAAIGDRLTAAITASKLLDKNNTELETIALTIPRLRLRIAIDGHAYGPYLVKTVDPISTAVLERYLQGLSRDELKTFLAQAQF